MYALPGAWRRSVSAPLSYLTIKMPKSMRTVNFFPNECQCGFAPPNFNPIATSKRRTSVNVKFQSSKENKEG